MTMCLVVDDNEVNRYATSEMIGICGFDSVKSETALQALDICKNSMPDYIILDIMMPEMNGYEFMTQLKKLDTDVSPHIIVSSARDGDADIKKAMKAGANEYLVKPMRLNDLKNILLNAENNKKH